MRRLALAVGACVLLAACGLPTPGGVQSAGEISEQQQNQGVTTRPPGPLPGQEPQEIVRGFLAAQSYPDEDFAVARSFLTPQAKWDPNDEGVRVVSPRLVVPEAPTDADQAVIDVTRDVVGVVQQDGWSRPAQQRDQRFSYELVKDRDQWRLSSVPVGLTLTAADRDRSMALVPVMFLSRSPGRTHLVSDLVRVINDNQLAPRLVRQVVERGPSAGLTTLSAASAVPPGTKVLGVQEQAPGSFVVDLSSPVRALGDRARQDLSAQLVWTLRLGLDKYNRPFNGLRLVVDGQPLKVDGDDGPQSRASWEDLDPSGNGSRPEALAVAANGRAVSLAADGDVATAFDTSVGRVVEAVEDASGPRVAVLTGPIDGEERTLSVGLAPGPFTPVRRGERLLSPTWGDGAYGIWALRRGDDPAVVLGEPGSATPVEVDGTLRLSGRSVLRISRDGARAALIDSSERLRLGRVQPSGDGLRITDLRQVTDDGVKVRDVAWVDGTTVMALVKNPDTDIPRPLLEIDVDGVRQTGASLNTGTDLFTTTLTAFGDQLLVASANPLPGSDRASLAVYRRVSGAFPDSGRISDLSRPRFAD